MHHVGSFPPLPPCPGPTLVEAAQELPQHSRPPLHVVVLQLPVELAQQLAAANAVICELGVGGVIGLAWRGRRQGGKDFALAAGAGTTGGAEPCVRVWAIGTQK